MSICELCEREVDVLSRHHLVPRCKLHKRDRKERKKFKNQEIPNLTYICKPCHSQIHTIFTEKELDQEYNELNKIKEHPEMQKFMEWIKKKPADFRLTVKR